MRFMKQDRPRLRNGRRSKLLVTAVTAALVLAAPGIVLARGLSDIFTDVPNTNPFHDDISAIRNAGITNGCNPAGTLYCPTDNVTREAMAAFMRRGFGRATEAPYPGSVALASSLTDLATLSITAGGAAGRTQFVKLDAVYNFYIQSGGATCPCQAYFNIQKDSGGSSGPFQYAQVDQFASTGWGMDAGAVTWVVAVPSGTTQTFRLTGSKIGGTGTMSAWGKMSAITVPFGSTGGSTLSLSSGEAPTGPAAPGR